MNLRIAVQKSGRLGEASLALLRQCGLSITFSKDRLHCRCTNLPVEVLLVRDDDIPRLLQSGVCQLGIVGQNTVAEFLAVTTTPTSPIPELRTLDFGRCRLSIAVPDSVDATSDTPESLRHRRIATSYPGLLRRYLESQRIEADIVVLSGAVEVAPQLGNAELVADLVSTGTTLRANHLREAFVIMESSAALFRAPGPYPRDVEALIERLLRRIDGVQQAAESKYVMLHAPRESLTQIRALLPGAEEPTLLPLDESRERYAVHAVCREAVFWDHLEDLRAAGATAVLVLPIEKMLA